MFGKKVYVDISTTQSGNLLRDKCVVITGGSEGIGAAIARKCISQGARVLITGRDEVKLHNFADAVDRDKVSVLNWDISDCTVIEENSNKYLMNWDKLIFGLIMPEYIGMLITVHAGYGIGMR